MLRCDYVKQKAGAINASLSATAQRAASGWEYLRERLDGACSRSAPKRAPANLPPSIGRNAVLVGVKAKHARLVHTVAVRRKLYYADLKKCYFLPSATSLKVLPVRCKLICGQ